MSRFVPCDVVCTFTDAGQVSTHTEYVLCDGVVALGPFESEVAASNFLATKGDSVVAQNAYPV